MPRVKNERNEVCSHERAIRFSHTDRLSSDCLVKIEIFAFICLLVFAFNAAKPTSQ